MTLYDDLRTTTAAAEAEHAATTAALAAASTSNAQLSSSLAGVQAQLADLTTDEALDEATIVSLRQQLADAIAQIPKPAARFPGDPGLGNMYVGLSTAGGDPTGREGLWETTVGAFRSYFQWNQNDQIVARAQRDLTAGRLPVISFKDSGRWGDVAAGKDDEVLVDLAVKLEAIKAPVILCLHHEPTDDTVAEGTPADFAGAQKRLNTLMPANVTATIILQSAPFDPTVGGNPAGLAAWVIDGSYDLLCFDTYNHRYYKPSPGNKYRDPATVLSFLDVVRKTLGKPDLPIGIAEFGTRTDPAHPGLAAQWLRDFVAQAKTLNVPFVCYFDSGMNVNDHGTPWSLDDKTDGTDGRERLEAYGPLVAAGAHITPAA